MSLEMSVMKLGYAINRGGDRALSENVKSCVKTHAWWGAIAMAIPLWGFETIIYVITLWTMYGRISSLSGVPFNGHAIKNIIGGFIVNIIVVFLLNFVLDWIAFFGWIGMGVIGYYATKLSGQAYVEVLVHLHGRDNVREHVDYEAFKQGFRNEPTPDARQRLEREAQLRTNSGGFLESWEDWMSYKPTPPPVRKKFKRSKD